MKYPLFGTGVETFGYSYFNVRPTTHNELSEWEFLYNKAHNEYLNFLATTGFIGLATYLFLNLSILYLFIKTLSSNSKNKALAVPLLIGYFSILITNFFGFSVVAVTVFFFLFPAFLLAPNNKLKEKEIALAPDPTIFFIILALVSGYALVSVSRMFRADLAYNLGKAYSQPNTLETSLNYLEKAVKLQPKEQLFLSKLAETEIKIAVVVKQQLQNLPATASAQVKASGQNMIQEYFQKALDHSQKAVNLNPHHTNLYKTKAKVELYSALIDPKFAQTALNTLLKLQELAPTDPKILFNIGVVYEDLNNIPNAIQAYQKALELKPDYEVVIAKLKALTK